ncbi:hypothetical protein FO519_010222, partial [Halicephalobus sp. NKZ332]
PWLHCNYCSRLAPGCPQFFFGNCGHIACDKCTENNVFSPKCIKCQRETTKIIEINEDMEEDAKKYFQNIGLIYENLCMSIKRTVEFQMRNADRLLNYKKAKIRELMANTTKDTEACELILQLQREKERLELDNKTLLQQSENLNQSRIDTSRMLLLGNGFVNMSGFSFMLASDTSSSIKSPDLFS